MATASERQTRRGFKAHCPGCDEINHLSIELQDVTIIRCGNCDYTMSTGGLRLRMAEWTALCDWLESAPEIGS